MAANLSRVNELEKSSFQVVLQEYTSQNKGVHFHPEYQISLVLQGEGSLMVSDQTQKLVKGDLFFLGPDLPHALFDKEEEGVPKLHLLSLYFMPDTFGKQFFQLPEMANVNQLFVESQGGLLWDEYTSKSIKRALLKLRNSPVSPQRIIMLLSILQKLSLATARKPITEPGFSPDRTTADSMFSQILQYIYDNFDKPISLEEMAELTHLNKYSFCRYFKRMTQMSFISYLNEFRISKACRFLLLESYNISQVGYLVGYNTLSNFYHQFNKIMHCTPSEYRDGGDLSLQEG